MTSEQFIISPMTREEAEQHVTAINNSATDMGRRLLALKEREGWRALGYETWTSCLEGEFSYSRKHLYELMKATPVLENLLPTGNKISTKAAAALADYDPALHPAITRTATARYGELTESNVHRVGRIVTEMSITGHVDTGNGTSSAVDAALDIEDYEAHLRRIQYMHDAAEKKSNTVIDADPDMEDHDGLTDHDEGNFRMGRQKPKTNRAGDKYIPQRQDLCQTPPYALDPLLPYLSNEWTIWEPACGEGLLVEGLYDSGIKSVVSGDIQTGQNFFEYTPEYWDCLVTNPPFSIKYDWLEHCYELQKPFALLIPVETLGAKTAQVLFRQHGIEVIFLDQRINFKMPNKGWDGNGAQFPVAWFTWGLNIGQQMVFASVRRNGEL